MPNRIAPHELDPLRAVLRDHFTHDTETGHLALKPDTPRNIVEANTGNLYFTFYGFTSFRVMAKHRLIYFLAHGFMPNYVLRKNNDITDDRAVNLLGFDDPHGKRPAKH